jgi:hypothetical protein
MTGLIVVGFLALIAVVVATGKHYGDRAVDEILGAELRAIDRDRQAGQSAGVAAMDALGKSANR